jgi:alanyl-tRNA synthetase
MMTSAQIRQSFLDFFKSKQHTIVPSSSLMPGSPNLLFTNAGMNQFVPIFLGQTKCPYTPGRAADTQKCIRAGGKHNDLDDVGLDTYHHTFFEMLGNWSFGDYFKKEAIDWAWELIVNVWKFPPTRLYATVYCPHMNMERWKNELHAAVEIAKKGGHLMTDDTSDIAQRIQKADEESATRWAINFLKAGLDPYAHIVPGSRKDNFWMMGETGPCGPCSELHVDLTPAGDTKGSLVNKGDARCIEIWNLVFIQFNANPDGNFSPLPAKHVDTGMGFERVTSIIQGTKNFSDFTNAKISNYETDIFRPIFDVLEKLSGKKYGSTLPGNAIVKVEAGEPLKSSGEARGNIIEVEAEERGAHSSSPCDDEEDFSIAAPSAEQVALDIAFRVIADHIRTLSFAIADGIQPGNTDRNYVLRRILRRAMMFGRTLGFHEPFLYKLVDVLADTMGDVLPEIRAKKKQVQQVIRIEEEAFNKTLDHGFERFFGGLSVYVHKSITPNLNWGDGLSSYFKFVENLDTKDFDAVMRKAQAWDSSWEKSKIDSIPSDFAFELYDTYGLPVEETERLARELGLTVDKEGFEKLMEEQRARARAAQKKTIIALQDDADLVAPTNFVGFENTKISSRVLTVIPQEKRWGVVLAESPFYAEMGGQVGDTGIISIGANFWRVVDTKKVHSTWLHIIEGDEPPAIGPVDFVEVDIARRNAIQRHHTVTHLLHWALHEVASREASQKGSFVGPDKLTFDFNSAPLTPEQVADVEMLVNERILENVGVSWTEVPHANVKNRKDVMQFFGDKYGDTVRVVQIGGGAGKLDGYSMELCGGTHTRATGEIGLFRIVGESAIAAGVRRIEAVAGLEAYKHANDEVYLIKTLAGKVNSPVHELDKKIEAMLTHQKELEKSLRTATLREASNVASNLLEQVHTLNGVPAIIHNIGGVDGDFLQAVVDALKSQFKGVIVLGGAVNGSVALVANVSPDFTAKVQAGKIIQTIATIVGGKGGGKPDNARGGGRDAGKLDEALAKAKTLLG